MNFKAIQNLKKALCILTERVDALEALIGDMIYLENVSSFDGETPSDLDSVVTDGVLRPKLYFFISVDAGFQGLRIVRLRDGADVQNLPYIVRPADYDPLDPAVFELVL